MIRVWYQLIGDSKDPAAWYLKSFSNYKETMEWLIQNDDKLFDHMITENLIVLDVHGRVANE